MKKGFSKQTVITILAACSVLIGCSQTVPLENIQQKSTQGIPEQQIVTETVANATNDTDNSLPTEPSSSSSDSEQTFPQTAPYYEMSIYTQAQNENSSVHIEYPIFYNLDRSSELNALILKTVQDFAILDPDYFPQDTKYTINYQSQVTLQNSNVVSIVFWGTRDIEVSAFPVFTLYTINVDPHSLKTIKLTDLYNVDKNFKKVFFEKSFYPSIPVSVYEKDYFSEMLEGHSDDYITIDPFDSPDTISFFLTSDGIVLSLPSAHAYGDHFEAELLYSDIQDYYIGEKN